MAFLLAKPTPHNVNHDNDRFSMFNKKRDIPKTAACSPTEPTGKTLGVAPPPMSIAFYAAPSRRSYPFSFQQNLRWS